MVDHGRKSYEFPVLSSNRPHGNNQLINIHSDLVCVYCTLVHWYTQQI